jgi:low molecular weight protein-tyrosine phosphatase
LESQIPTRRITFVCRANQARSPLAAALLAQQLAMLGDPADGYSVSSAGTDAREGAGVIPHMRTAAAEQGVDLSAHEAFPLDAVTVAGSDLILTMTEMQRGLVSRLQPQALSKTFTLKEIVRLCTALSPAPARWDLKALATALHRHRALVPQAVEPEDIADPDGLDLAGTTAVAEEIGRLVTVVAKLLASPV